MAFSLFNFNPTDGVKNETSFPNTPTNGMREAIQRVLGQIQTYINNMIGTLNSTSGADNIGSANITGVANGTVQVKLADLKAQIDDAALGAIPDASLTDIKLDPDIKIGSLGDLDTTEQGSVVGAINEVFAKFYRTKRDTTGAVVYETNTTLTPNATYVGGAISLNSSFDSPEFTFTPEHKERFFQFILNMRAGVRVSTSYSGVLRYGVTIQIVNTSDNSVVCSIPYSSTYTTGTFSSGDIYLIDGLSNITGIMESLVLSTAFNFKVRYLCSSYVNASNSVMLMNINTIGVNIGAEEPLQY